MSTCHECGSDVAEQDIFCPYCGISLREISVGDSPADAFERTIMIQAPPKPITVDEVPFDNTQRSTIEDETTPRSSPIEGVEPEETVGDSPQGSPEAEEMAMGNHNGLGAEEQSVFVEEDSMSKTAPHPEEAAIAEKDSVSEVDFIADRDPRVEDELTSEEDSPIVASTSSGSSSTESVYTDPPNIFRSFEGEVSQLVDDGPVENPVADETTYAELDAAIPSGQAESDMDQPFGLAEPLRSPDRNDNDDLVPTEVQAGGTEVEPAPHLEFSEIGAVIDVEPMLDSSTKEEGVFEESTSHPIQDRVVVVERDPIDELSGNADENHSNENPTNGGDTSSGDISDDDKQSLTSPNLEGSTDGRKSGLKPLAEGTLLNSRYQIVKKIGGGGMGAVYLAIDQNLGGTQRAVKEMVQSHIEEEQQAKAIEDFKRESMILSTLDHPSIPTIYDYFYDAGEGRFYLVMKYISGGDLAARLRSAPEGRIDERSVTEWALQVIDVLHYLHSLPTTIVYRDLKPSNVMIDGNTGRIMLIDFGIARSINQTQEKGVTAVGTMGYAPPELFSGQVEPRSDIYSLGSTMFHLLTGADPQNNPLLIFDFQKNPRPRQINPRLSDQIERILMRAVEYSAEARFSSALEMKLALQMHLEDLRNGNVTYGITEAPAAVSLANQNVFCGFCGQRIVATDLFCAFCGSKQPLAQHGVHSEIYSSRSAATARLVIDGTSELISPAYTIEKNENLVGRRDPMSNIFPEVDLSKYDPQTKISRRHARIWRDGTSFLVEDLGSSNGTILLSTVSDTLRLVPHQPHPLANGDRIRVGDTTLHFIVG